MRAILEEKRSKVEEREEELVKKVKVKNTEEIKSALDYKVVKLHKTAGL